MFFFVEKYDTLIVVDGYGLVRSNGVGVDNEVNSVQRCPVISAARLLGKFSTRFVTLNN